jgi:hypothetical protein
VTVSSHGTYSAASLTRHIGAYEVEKQHLILLSIGISRTLWEIVMCQINCSHVALEIKPWLTLWLPVAKLRPTCREYGPNSIATSVLVGRMDMSHLDWLLPTRLNDKPLCRIPSAALTLGYPSWDYLVLVQYSEIINTNLKMPFTYPFHTPTLFAGEEGPPTKVGADQLNAHPSWIHTFSNTN